MLKPELLAKLTPEAIAALDPADKQRVLDILRDLELTGYQRHMRDLKAAHGAWIADCERRGVDPSEERKAHGLPVLGEVLAKVRKLLDERERRNDPEWQLTPGEKLRRELYNAPDHQAFLAREAARAGEEGSGVSGQLCGCARALQAEAGGTGRTGKRTGVRLYASPACLYRGSGAAGSRKGFCRGQPGAARLYRPNLWAGQRQA
jgi:hypothetical protein